MGKLYERCPICKGQGFTMVKTENLYSGYPDNTTVDCQSCSATGFIETGLTTGQVNRLVREERIRRGDP